MKVRVKIIIKNGVIMRTYTKNWTYIDIDSELLRDKNCPDFLDTKTLENVLMAGSELVPAKGSLLTCDACSSYQLRTDIDPFKRVNCECEVMI